MFDLDLRTVGDWLQWLVMGAIGLLMWTRRPGEEAAAAVRALREQIDASLTGVRERLARVEATLEHIPTDQELGQIAGAVRALEARAEALAAGMDSLRAQMNRIEQYLLLHEK